MRVLVTVPPRMYREAIALSVHRDRPHLDVRVAPPEAAAGQIEAFRPHLLVHNDTAPIPEGVLGDVPWRVEVLYSDSMDARVSAEGRVEQIGDMDTGDLLRVVDRAAELADGEASLG
jgi:hypothetical protein